MLDFFKNSTPSTRLYLFGILYAAFVLYQRHQLSNVQRVSFAGKEFLEDNVNGTGTWYRVVTRGSQTGGSKAEIDVYARHTGHGFYPKLPASTPYHSHPEQEEALAVLEGEMGYNLNGTQGVAKAGEVLIVPAGTPHAVWCATSQPMWFRVTVTPAAPFTEAFFENLAGLGATYGGVAHIPVLQVMVLFQEYGVKLEGMPNSVSWALRHVLPPFARSLGYQGAYQEYVSAGAAAGD